MLSPLPHWKSERPGGRVDAAASGGRDKSRKDYQPIVFRSKHFARVIVFPSLEFFGLWFSI